MKYFLTGLAGVGKSFFGQEWASQFHLPFYDLDILIEEKTGDSIENIFTEKGENIFRQTEHEVLLSTININNGIIACGGGTPCFHHNMDWMNDHGTTIWLQQKIDLAASNINNDPVVRPLFKNNSAENSEKILESLLSRRKEFYAQAKFIIDLSGNYTPDLHNIFSKHA